MCKQTSNVGEGGAAMAVQLTLVIAYWTWRSALRDAAYESGQSAPSITLLGAEWGEAAWLTPSITLLDTP